MWTSVKREAWLAIQLSVFASASIDRPISEDVFSSDACLTGVAVMQTTFDRKTVEHCLTHRERSRYLCGVDASRARVRALNEEECDTLGVVFWESRSAHFYKAVKDFPEIPSALLKKER